MKQYSSTIALFTVLLLTACGGGSSGTTSSTDAGTTDGGTADGGTTAGQQMDGEPSTDAGGTGMLSDVAGVWDMSIDGSIPREEYWNIGADGTFNTYTYREMKDIYIADAGQGLDVARCYEKQVNTITSTGDGVYGVQGLFRDERYGASIELDINANGTLQAKYNTDILVCGLDGCSPEYIDSSFAQVASDFNPENLYLCPTSIVSVSSLITSDTDINSGSYWNCSFENQDDRAAEITTAQVRIGGAGQGLVTVNGNDRPFGWFSRNDTDLTGIYDDGTGTFTLTNLILNSSDGDTSDGFNALDASTRFADDGSSTVTYFEMDCALVSP